MIAVKRSFQVFFRPLDSRLYVGCTEVE